MPLNGKVALITGGAKRVGAAISRRLHSQGCNIVLHYRSSLSEAQTLADELNRLRPDSVVLAQADLLQTESLSLLVDASCNAFGQLDILVNNASSFYATAIGEMNEASWQDLIGTNLKAPLFLSQAAVPELQKTRGCIINITDIHAERPMKSYIIYSIGKAGLVALTKSLARELAPAIRVNAVAPGPIAWPENNPDFSEATRQEIIAHTPLQRGGEPDDIARAVSFLVQDGPFITGQVLAVDGGRSVRL